MNGKKEEMAIIQNLRDAGCDDCMISAFVEDVKEGNMTEGLKLLSMHRRFLLDNLHEEQKRIDCLDYLVYKMKKTNEV